MHHVFQSCDRIVAMARGEIVFDKPIGDTSIDEVAGALVSGGGNDGCLQDASCC